MFTVPSTRRTLVASLALVVAPLAGCAARPDRFARFQEHAGTRTATSARAERRDVVAAPPDVRRGEMTGRAGYASFKSQVRLRDDTPSVTQVIESERAALAATRRMERIDAEREYFAGPEGSVGLSDPACYPGFQPSFSTPYFGPVGAVPPGLRPAFDDHVHSPIFTAPRNATPDADTWSHRPGLSTGSGIYGRHDSR